MNGFMRRLTNLSSTTCDSLTWVIMYCSKERLLLGHDDASLNFEDNRNQNMYFRANTNRYLHFKVEGNSKTETSSRVQIKLLQKYTVHPRKMKGSNLYY